MLRTIANTLTGLAVLLMIGCAASSENTDGQQDEMVASTEEAVHTFRFTVFENPYGDNRLNPLQNMRGIANGYVAKNTTAVSGLKEWTVTGLELFGLPANRTFGAHAHALKCEDTQGGGHYQNVAGSIDPTNSEIWLDFTTDARGRAQVKVLSPFAVRPGGVQSIVIHTDPTNPTTAKAGAKLACANITLD